MKIRPGDSKVWQIVKQGKTKKIPPHSFVLLGVPDDRGVAISRGRTGAKKGPNAIRKELFKMTLGPRGELGKIKLWDLGNLKLEKTQKATYQKLADTVCGLLSKRVFPIILGGGHDLSFGSLSGFLRAYPDGKIINIDPHLDVRPPESKGKFSSGTAFCQLLENSLLKRGHLLEFGYQTHCNSKTHFEYLKRRGVHLVPFMSLRGTKGAVAIQKFAAGKKALAISFDMDCVQALEAPGVSALTPIGYTAREVLAMVQTAARHPNLKMFEVMEVNPRFDPDGRTSKLAALLILYYMVTKVILGP